jgi:hypothetical protein
MELNSGANAFLPPFNFFTQIRSSDAVVLPLGQVALADRHRSDFSAVDMVFGLPGKRDFR